MIFPIITTAQIYSDEQISLFSDRLIVKLKSNQKDQFIFQNNSLMNFSEIKRKFPLSESPHLKNIYEIKIQDGADLFKLSDQLITNENIEYAEPVIINFLQSFIPNDSLFSEQWYLDKINAPEAWETTKGDSTIVIAIIDSGVDWLHKDLNKKIWTNDDPINGIDDDGNGYVDDFRGWDFGGAGGLPDNDPNEDRPDHGTAIAGAAAAKTGNSIGIASVGINSKLMPVKVTSDDTRASNGSPLVLYGYEGIIYAVDNGAKIINCSWGSSIRTDFAQDVINYAIENDVLIVASAGNSGIGALIYPAAFDNVLSVGATDVNDISADFSNYNYALSVSSPGVNIVSTWKGDGYKSLSGTSMASPIVAGTASLVMEQFPELTAQQVLERIRVSSDKIDYLNGDRFAQTGYGRINVQRAVANDKLISVRLNDFSITNETKNDSIYEPGEELSLVLTLENYLDATTSLNIRMISFDNYSSFVNDSYYAGEISPGNIFSTSSNPILIRLSSPLPRNQQMDYIIEFADVIYKDYKPIAFTVNPEYRTIESDDLTFTMTDKGTFGYNDYPFNEDGHGVTFFNSDNILFQGGLLIGSDKFYEDSIWINELQVISPVAFRRFQQTAYTATKPVTVEEKSAYADKTANLRMQNLLDRVNNLQIVADLNTYYFDMNEEGQILIFHYKIANPGKLDFSIYSGLYFDFDLSKTDKENDNVIYDLINKYGYAFHDDDEKAELFIGGKLLSYGNQNFYPINNNDRADVSVYPVFPEFDQFKTISSGTEKMKSGPGDVSFSIGGGPYLLRGQHFLNVSVVLAAAKSKRDLDILMDKSSNIYNNLPIEIGEEIPENVRDYSLMQNYPNPFNSSTTIVYSIPYYTGTQKVNLIVYDLLGKHVETLVSDYQQPGLYNVSFNVGNLSSGVYFYLLETHEFREVKKMLIIK